MVKTAVLFETYIRDDYARQVFEALKIAKPQKLYFYSNKARPDRPDEVRRNELIRSWVNEIDWDCDLHTFFREEYVDQYTSLSGAINWVFDNEEQAIILEDDCVPSLAFFDYCEKMLEKYKDEPRVWMISGDNYLEDYNPHGYDIMFTKDMQIYGWASWHDRWKKIDWDYDFVSDYEKCGFFDSFFSTKQQRKYYKKLYASQHEFINRTHCWDYVFVNTGWRHNALAVFPARNLVENIGLDGVHAKQNKKAPYNKPVTYNKDSYDVVKVPPFFQDDYLFENKVFYLIRYKQTMLRYRIINKVLRIFYKLKSFSK